MAPLVEDARWQTLALPIAFAHDGPTTNELAIATTWYRARTTVEVDEKRVELYALDGTRVARVDVVAR